MSGTLSAPIDVLWCRLRGRHVCSVCSLAPVEPPRGICQGCRHWLVGRARAREQHETIADLPGVGELFAQIRPRRQERTINGRPESEVPSHELPRDPGERVAPEEVVGAIRAAPGSLATALAERLGCSKPTVDRHAARLADEGLVRIERDPGGRRYWPIEPQHRRSLSPIAHEGPRTRTSGAQPERRVGCSPPAHASGADLLAPEVRR